MRTPFSVSMSYLDVLAASSGKKLVTEGMFVASINNVARFLPRARTNTAILTSSPTFTLNTPCFSFKAGDVLYAKAGYGELLFTGTPAASDVVTVSINQVNYSVTAPASPTLATVAAAWITANNTALTAAGIIVTQRASTGSIIVTAKDSYKVNTFSSNGAFQCTLNSSEAGYLGDSTVPLGTILAIGNADVNERRVVTLAANAAFALPVNSPIGVNEDEILGIYPDPLDFTDEPVMHIAPICEADGVYEQNLPYVDEQLKRKLSDLRIFKKFFKASV